MNELRASSRAPSSQSGPAGAGNAVAWRVYEICVSKGYVDGRDWFEADAELRAEARRVIRRATVDSDTH
jgi:sigma54-dependent transcription regulator